MSAHIDDHWMKDAPEGMFYISSFTRPDLSYGVDPVTGEVFCKHWRFFDAEGNDVPDDLMANTRRQLAEYDQMKMAATCRDDDAVTDWFLQNAETRNLSLELIVPLLLDWFGPSEAESAYFA